MKTICPDSQNVHILEYALAYTLFRDYVASPQIKRLRKTFDYNFKNCDIKVLKKKHCTISKDDLKSTTFRSYHNVIIKPKTT